MSEPITTALTVCGIAVIFVVVLILFAFLTNMIDDKIKEDNDERNKRSG